jgi:hypothetical protein
MSVHDREKFNEIIGDTTKWIKYYKVDSSDITHCICKHAIKTIYKIVNKETGDEAFLGSKCIQRTYVEDKQNFNLSDRTTLPKQLFYNDTIKYNDRQDMKMNQLLKRANAKFKFDLKTIHYYLSHNAKKGT